MKDILGYYARCNQKINAQMYQLVADQVPEGYDLKVEGYFFHTLGQILDHLLASDLIWMKAFLEVEAYGLDVAARVRPVPNYGERLYGTLAESWECRQKLDQFIVDYVAATQDDLFAKTLSRKSRDGTPMVKNVGKALVHFFNHQTHHRGQISQILDARNVENNYSNMIFLE